MVSACIAKISGFVGKVVTAVTKTIVLITKTPGLNSIAPPPIHVQCTYYSAIYDVTLSKVVSIWCVHILRLFVCLISATP